MPELSITNTLAQIIDKWWGIILPFIIMMAFRQYFSNLIIYISLRWSQSPYAGMGNQVEISGKEWTILKITLGNVYLERKDKKGIIWVLRMNIKKYSKENLIYKKI